MRVVALLVFFVLATGAAWAQSDNTTTGDGAAAGNDTATGNDTTTGNDTPVDDGGDTPPAAPDCPTEITLLGLDDLAWHLPEGGRANPPLNVCPSADITFTIIVPDTEGIPHNFAVQAPDAPAPTTTLSAGDETTYVWSAPESGSFVYICTIHPQTMKGTVTAGAPATGGGGSSEGDDTTGAINGPSVQLKQIAPNAPCDKEIPAIVARDTVGGPTANDYVESCVQTAESEAPADHAADVVLPLSFAAVAIGVLGMVWVHKYYKP